MGSIYHQYIFCLPSFGSSSSRPFTSLFIPSALLFDHTHPSLLSFIHPSILSSPTAPFILSLYTFYWVILYYSCYRVNFRPSDDSANHRADVIPHDGSLQYWLRLLIVCPPSLFAVTLRLHYLCFLLAEGVVNKLSIEAIIILIVHPRGERERERERERLRDQ